MMLSALDKKLLEKVADMHEVPQGAYSIRKDGEGFSANSSANIIVRPKEGKPGIDVIVKPNTVNESVHVPVIMTQAGVEETVYNLFDIGESSDVYIVAGCGIHNNGNSTSRHDGEHKFIVGKNSRMKYVEKHYGEGTGSGGRIMNPKTIIEVMEGGTAELEMVQIRGIDTTERETSVILHKDAKLVVTERLLTDGEQIANSKIDVELKGEDSTAQIISRSVAKGNSKQEFYLAMDGKNKCRGHIQCDSIIMDDAVVSSIPKVAAMHSEANLIHEAAIGRIANEQLLKLQSLGYTSEEAEEIILNGFLK